MGYLKLKWKPVFLLQVLLLNVFIKSLPISTKLPSLTTIDTSFPKLELPEDLLVADVQKSDEILTEELASGIKTETINDTSVTVVDLVGNNGTRNLLRNLRPGQEVRQYDVQLTFDGGQFHGRVVIDVRIDTATRDDPLVFHIEDLNIESVMVGIFTDANAQPTDYNDEDGILEIFPEPTGTTYVVIVEYSGQISDTGGAIVESNFMDSSYITMNLFPTNARRVFPCVDEPTLPSTVKFTFNNLPYAATVLNSMPEEGSTNEFRALQGPVHLWGMVAHNFVNMINIIISQGNILLFGRSGIRNQDSQASIAISNYYTALDLWTDKPYFETVVNQDGRMVIFSLPDTNRDWYALSTVNIWEPHIFMEIDHSVKQRKTALATIAEAMARQWFGYIIHAENWKDQWVIQGLGTYAAYQVFQGFQTNEIDLNLLDVNTLFVADVIQESLLLDGRVAAAPLQLEEEIFEEPQIRDHINGLLKLKSPAIMRMLRLVLGGEFNDYIQSAARVLLNNRALQTVDSHNFVDAINSEWLFSDNRIIDDVTEFLEPWLFNQGYPVVIVGLRQGGLLLTQEHFCFSSTDPVTYDIPITYTTSLSPNYDTENVHSVTMIGASHIINTILGEEDFVIFNIQGQGYYRVNYDNELWFRIIEALNDPERREEIHPLNRATLVDDALNLARAGILQYDTAFQVVLSMEHEMDYAVWKAFVRNMDFIRKRLTAYVQDEEEERDPDIYLRMVRRTIRTVEDELGFYPDPLINEPPMHSLTRGLVMDHACRANYAPCIAAAVDWFYDSNSDEPTVNPDIPPEIRPAVYCTMVREGDADVISALYARLDIEESMYERVVILESLGCSRDEGFINTLLQETIAVNSPYGTEERSKIFTAIADSSYDNAELALNFISMRTMEVRDRYGGPAKLEELIYKLVDNIVLDLFPNFQNWINNVGSNLDDSTDAAMRAREMVSEDVNWEINHMEGVYEWIDENNASTVVTSLVLLSFSLVVTLFW